MNITTDTKYLRWCNSKESDSYEWWYFDAIDTENDCVIAAKFLLGNPLSPGYNRSVTKNLINHEIKKPNPLNFSSFLFSVYLNKRIIYRAALEYSKKNIWVEDENGFEKISFNQCGFHYEDMGEDKNFFLDINLTDSKIRKKIKANFIFKKKSDTTQIQESLSNRKESFWHLSAPVCEVNGKIKLYGMHARRKLIFKGLGYCDHNWGRLPNFQNIKNWYWGRMLADKYSLIYMYIQHDSQLSKPFKKLLIYKDDQLLFDLNDYTISFKYSRSYWMLKYNYVTTIQAGDISLTSIAQSRIENEPFNIRFISNCKFSLYNRVVLDKLQGISEYINPKRLMSSLLRMLAGFRVKRI